MMSIFKKNRKAFTIIELIVVIAILGILVLLAGPRLLGYVGKAELRRIQHDVKVMEQEIGTVFVSKDGDFKSWEDNSKDLNQLIEENKLLEKEGPVADEVEPTDEPYKVIPEKYKDNINTKLKGTFYANSGGKVYYEHTKPLVGIPSGPEKEPGDNNDDGANPEQPGDNNDDGDIGDNPEQPGDNDDGDNPEQPGDNNDEKGLMNPIEPRDTVEGETAIDSADELTKIGTTEEYPLSGKYILTSDIDLSGINWVPIGTSSKPFTGSFDGNGYKIINLTSNWPEQSYVGLFGYTDKATIENVALEDVDITGAYRTGGLVGGAYNSSTITNSYATGSVKGEENYTGGLVGIANSSSVTNSYAKGAVTGKGSTGGLVGQAWSSTKISNSYATGEVTGSGQYVGGLVGIASGSAIIENSYATGSVTGGSEVGGLAGNAGDGTSITNSYATGAVNGGSSTGGLVGDVHTGTIENSYATGEVTGTGNNTGGLVGNSTYNSTISNSHATGSVSGSGDSTGGLVGYAGANASINNSYSTGSVSGTGNNVGGLVGMARALSGSSPEINNSYATGSVTGTGDNTGGLVGCHYGIIRKSYATGEVSGTSEVGGFVGWAYPGTPSGSGRAFDSYWDKETTGQANSATEGFGRSNSRSTIQMKTKNNYKDWDFDTIWQINEGESYPTLR